MKLANYNDMHKISDEFENGSDQTNNAELRPLDCQKLATIDLLNSVTSSVVIGFS